MGIFIFIYFDLFCARVVGTWRRLP